MEKLGTFYSHAGHYRTNEKALGLSTAWLDPGKWFGRAKPRAYVKKKAEGVFVVLIGIFEGKLNQVYQIATRKGPSVDMHWRLRREA